MSPKVPYRASAAAASASLSFSLGRPADDSSGDTTPRLERFKLDSQVQAL